MERQVLKCQYAHLHWLCQVTLVIIYAFAWDRPLLAGHFTWCVAVVTAEHLSLMLCSCHVAVLNDFLSWIWLYKWTRKGQWNMFFGLGDLAHVCFMWPMWLLRMHSQTSASLPLLVTACHPHPLVSVLAGQHGQHAELGLNECNRGYQGKNKRNKNQQSLLRDKAGKERRKLFASVVTRGPAFLFCIGLYKLCSWPCLVHSDSSCLTLVTKCLSLAICV